MLNEVYHSIGNVYGLCNSNSQPSGESKLSYEAGVDSICKIHIVRIRQS